MRYDMYSRPGMSYTSGFFILMGLMGVGLIFSVAIAAGLWMVMTGTGFGSMQQEMNNPANVQVLRLLQLVSTFFMFFLPAYFTSLILSKRPLQLMGFHNRFTWRELALAIVIMLTSLPLVGALSQLTQMIPLPASLEQTFSNWEKAYEDQVKVLSRIDSFGDYLLSLVIMALAPAIFEETFFRGGMQNLLEKGTGKGWLAIGITAVLFSAIHFSFYGFIARVALGVVLGLIFHYSQSLWLSIACHFFNNALVVTQIYVLNLQGKSVDDAMKETGPLWIGVFVLFILFGLFRFYKQYCAETRERLMPLEDRARTENWIA